MYSWSLSPNSLPPLVRLSVPFVIVNFIEIVPPLVRFSSWTTTFIPLVSPSAEAMPAGAAAAGAAAAAVVAGAAAGGGAAVAVVAVAVGAADDDVAVAGSFFEQA